MRANLPPPAFFLGKPLPARAEVALLERVDSGNDGHLFSGYSSNLGKRVACKVIPRANLLHGPEGEEIWRREVHKADALRSSTVVKFEDIQEWVDRDAQLECVVLISEFVEGPSLRKFIAGSKGEVTIPFIVHWLATMLNLLNEMKIRDISHGDLHAGNILVEDRSAYDIQGPRFVFRVTDFGVADATSDRRFKDDYLQIADVLEQLLRVVDYASLSPRDKYTFIVLRDHFLARHLVESDPTRDPLAKQPAGLFLRLREIDSAFDLEASQGSAHLLTPFDFLSCEQIGDAAALLRALYSDRFLGLPEIEGRNNVVVTGPRGCGKSTVFRSLSLDQRVRVAEAVPEQVTYIGIYYRCDDLYFAFPRYVSPSNSEAIDIPVHFITATLLGRLLTSLEGWSKQYFHEEFVSAQPRAAAGMWEALGVMPPREPGSETLKAVIAQLDKQRRKATEWNRFANDPKRNPGHCFGPEVLQRACEELRKAFTFLRNRPVYFFVDDYSSPKVTKELQRSLNRVLMQRNPFCFFKLSTESPVSFSKRDVDDKVYVESREFVLHNLGLIYLHADVGAKLSFIEDVFRRRFATVEGFPVRSLEELVGSNSEQNHNESARQIREGKKPSLWGKETLCSLCSGDIHYVISLVGEMVKAVGGLDSLAQAETKIPRGAQNQAIRQMAGNFLKNLRSLPNYGERLVAIVEAFGNVSHSHLKHLDSKNVEGHPPKQATRIEPYEPFTFSEESQKIYDELLRYSVFIEDYRGKSRRGHVVPRLFLRRFLIPHFNLTFSTRDSIELEPTEFEMFLLRPEEFEEEKRIRDAKHAQRIRREGDKSQVGDVRVDQLALDLWPKKREE